jgi:lysophospholipase L1-like esterase
VLSCPAPSSGTAGTQVSISCTATDDGLPAGSILSPSWTVVSSPAAITLTGGSTLAPKFTPTVAGTYALKLSVSDSQLTSTANVTVNVTAPTNSAPQLSCQAVPSAVIGKPVTVNCSAVDDGLPAGSSLALNWSWVSGPTAPAVSGQGTSNASFTPTVAGSYSLRLTASDGLLSQSTVVNILVLSSVTKSVQPLGASLTNGYWNQQSYRYPLWKKLLDLGAKFDFVGTLNTVDGGDPPFPDYLGKSFDRDHEGHSGWTTWGISSGLPGWLPQYNLDVSLIHLGTNDMLWGTSASPADAINGLTAVVQALRARNPNIHIYVAQIIPVDPTHPNFSTSGDFSGLDARIRDFNSRMPAWAASLGTAQSPIKIVDQYTGFNARVDTIDGIHPGPTGQEKIAQRFFDAIKGEF